MLLPTISMIGPLLTDAIRSMTPSTTTCRSKFITPTATGTPNLWGVINLIAWFEQCLCFRGWLHIELEVSYARLGNWGALWTYRGFPVGYNLTDSIDPVYNPKIVSSLITIGMPSEPLVGVFIGVLKLWTFSLLSTTDEELISDTPNFPDPT